MLPKTFGNNVLSKIFEYICHKGAIQIPNV